MNTPAVSLNRASGRTALARYGEDLAARRLTAAGMTVLERNWRCRDGEIDIVARDGNALVVVEVKTRSGTDYEHPMRAVTAAKLDRLRRLAERWLAERWPAHAPAAGPPPGGVRIDLVGVIRPRTGAARVEHVRGL